MWAILAAVTFVVMFRCAWNSIPEPRTLTEAPTPRPGMTVLPSQTPYQFPTMVPTRTVTPQEAILLGTSLPTRTRTPMPAATVTPVPTSTPDKTPVQRG